TEDQCRGYRGHSSLLSCWGFVFRPHDTGKTARIVEQLVDVPFFDLVNRGVQIPGDRSQDVAPGDGSVPGLGFPAPDFPMRGAILSPIVSMSSMSSSLISSTSTSA